MFVLFHTHNCLFVCICHRHVYICLMTIKLFDLILSIIVLWLSVRLPKSKTIYKIGICCFSAKDATFRGKSKDWLDRNQNNVSEWSDIFKHGMLFQGASAKKSSVRMMVLSKCKLFSSWYSWIKKLIWRYILITPPPPPPHTQFY